MTLINNFYKGLGYTTNTNIDKPVFYFHIPKCGGTTLCVIISHLLKKTHRSFGPLFKNNDKGGITAFENYLSNEKAINANHLDFLYGHFPFEIYHRLKEKNFFYFTTIRDPIERCISHYTWGIERGFFSSDENIEELFLQNKLQQNLITNQFSGKFLNNNNSIDTIKISIANIKKLDLLVDMENTNHFLNYFISLYDLPNIFFQYQQVQNSKKILSESTVDVIKSFNQLDIELYHELKEQGLIFDKFPKKNKSRNKLEYLYSSPNILLNNKKSTIVDNNNFKILEKKLIDKNYKIVEI